MVRAAERRDWLAAAFCLGLALQLVGCSHPAPATLPGPSFASRTIGVAPALTHGGRDAFDPVQVADLSASELHEPQGVNVLGPNRVQAAVEALGVARIESAEQALQTAEFLGADRIIILAITEYDSYDPPVLGIAAQLYAPKRSVRRWDAQTGEAEGPGPTRRPAPVIHAQVQRVYNAAHEPIVKAVGEFADLRNTEDSPFGWRKYLVSQWLCLRFCCHSTVRELMRQEYWHMLNGVEPAA